MLKRGGGVYGTVREVAPKPRSRLQLIATPVLARTREAPAALLQVAHLS